MIRRRLLRMLLVWREQTEKEIRIRYINGTLPQVIWCVRTRDVLAPRVVRENADGLDTNSHSSHVFALQVARPAEAIKGLANLHDYLNDLDAGPARVRRGGCWNRTTKEPDFTRPGRRTEPKGYLHIHIQSTSHRKALQNC